VCFHQHGDLFGFGPKNLSQDVHCYQYNLGSVRTTMILSACADCPSARFLIDHRVSLANRWARSSKSSQTSSISVQLAHRPPFTAFLPPVYSLNFFRLQTVASFLTLPQPDPLFSSKSVASFFKSSELLSRQPSGEVERLMVLGRRAKNRFLGLDSSAFNIRPSTLFLAPTVASFLTFPQPDPLFSSKSVASFFKSSELSAVRRSRTVDGSESKS